MVKAQLFRLVEIALEDEEARFAMSPTSSLRCVPVMATSRRPLASVSMLPARTITGFEIPRPINSAKARPMMKPPMLKMIAAHSLSWTISVISPAMRASSASASLGGLGVVDDLGARLRDIAVDQRFDLPVQPAPLIEGRTIGGNQILRGRQLTGVEAVTGGARFQRRQTRGDGGKRCLGLVGSARLVPVQHQIDD